MKQGKYLIRLRLTSYRLVHENVINI